jgi:hypothetical protein
MAVTESTGQLEANMASVELLITKLRELGGSANNPDLKRALGVDGADWDLLKRSAIKTGLVEVGRGFGGRLIIAEKASGATTHKSDRKMLGGTLGSKLVGKKVVVLDKEDLQSKAAGTIVEITEGESVVTIIVE